MPCQRDQVLAAPMFDSSLILSIQVDVGQTETLECESVSHVTVRKVAYSGGAAG